MRFRFEPGFGIILLRLLQGENLALAGIFEVQICEMPKNIDSRAFDAHCEKIFFEVLFADFRTDDVPFFELLLAKKMEVKLVYFLIAVNDGNQGVEGSLVKTKVDWV